MSSQSSKVSVPYICTFDFNRTVQYSMVLSKVELSHYYDATIAANER